MFRIESNSIIANKTPPMMVDKDINLRKQKEETTMGILMAIGIGAIMTTVAGGSILVYKEGQRSLSKVDRLIKEVDSKPDPPKRPEDDIKKMLDKVNKDEVNARWILKEIKTVPEQTVKEMVQDVDKAIVDLELDEEDEIDFNELPINRMEIEFQERYAFGPVYQAPKTVFGRAYDDGLISKETYDRAFEYYGEERWTYVGD